MFGDRVQALHCPRELIVAETACFTFEEFHLAEHLASRHLGECWTAISSGPIPNSSKSGGSNDYVATFLRNRWVELAVQAPV